MIEASKPEDDPITSRGERLSELRRRAHAEWEPWAVNTLSMSNRPNTKGLLNSSGGVNSMNFEETYSHMDNDELLRLTSQWKTLTEPAQAALATELEKRKLGNEFKSERQIALEKPIPSSGSPSGVERVMFLLFIVSLPSMILLPRIWPENMRFGLYEMLDGLSYLWSVWLIVWLVLRARRIQKTR